MHRYSRRSRPWPGKVVELARSIDFVAEWTLASGERREMPSGVSLR